MPPENVPLVAIILSALVGILYSATPLILAAQAGVICERAGVVNIALEGLLIAGAFAGAVGGQVSGVLGVLLAIFAGVALGLLHAFMTQAAKANHVLSGLAITMLALGATQFLSRQFFASGIEVKPIPREIFPILAVLFSILLALALRYTQFGLRLRSVGENPESARMAGVSPIPIRYAALALSGALGGLAGAFLSVSSHTPGFSPGMSAGKGYIALAAVIFGKWNPIGALLGAIFFGMFGALETLFQINNWDFRWFGIEWKSPFLLKTFPYLLTLIALVTVVRRAAPPAALGKEDEA